jgi:hypothetical protein
MKKKRDRLRVREIEVERLVAREPKGGRPRAVIETVPTRRGRAARVALTLYAPDGEPALVAEVNHRGEPRLSVGHPDHGPTVSISREAVDVWSRGNVVAALGGTGDGGRLELTDGQGRLRRNLLGEGRRTEF